MVRAEIECRQILAIAPVDYDTSRDTQPGSYINRQLEIMQAKGGRFRNEYTHITAIQRLNDRTGSPG
jgi:hypothetical protein